MFNAFVERLHTEMSSFHLPLSEISITLDNVLWLLHLSIRGKLLDHGTIRKDKALELKIDYLGVDLEDAMRELEKTRGPHARFEFLKKLYTYELFREKQAKGDVEKVGIHKVYAMRPYLLYLLHTVIFMDKIATYVDVVYLRYFEDFE